jgi:phosphoribosylformylglycinamidine synthase
VKREAVKVAIVRMEGSNCEEELHRCFAALGARPELVHLNQLTGRAEKRDRRSLEDYHVLMFPGGFSAGDYIRAGAIFAARMKASIGKDVEKFVEAGKPVGGFCNGFQIMVEMGLLPALEGISAHPEAALHVNDSGHYECRPTLLKHTSKGAFTAKIPKNKVLAIPSAHAEGKLMFPKGQEGRMVRKLEENGQIAFRYVDPEGSTEAGYPWNPNGSPGNIAGLTNPEGTLLGLMPHPERAFWRWQHADWTRAGKADGPGDGQALFESVLAHVEKKF